MTNDEAAGARGQPAIGPDHPSPEQRRGAKIRGAGRVNKAAEWGKRKYAGSFVDSLWRRLDALDFMNQAMILAATLLLCAFPFALVLAALTGRSATRVVARRLGLNPQAAGEVSHLVTSTSATSAAVTGLAWAFFILAGLAIAGAIQGRYERIFDLRPRGARDMPRKLIWLGVTVGWVR